MTDASQGLEAWIGTSRVAEDVVSLRRARALAATLDRPPDALREGDPLPAGWHWIYFNELTARSEVAADGHAERGGFLPPVPHPHRMWAGGRLLFPGVLRIGAAASRTSTIEAIEAKEGRSGPLVFVTVGHEISTEDGIAIDEQIRLVYLTRDKGASAPRSTDDGTAAPDWTETFTADEVTLFRFSALTLNSHRIHYDHPYATQVEGYPGLVVHGPLIALLLLDAGVRHAPPDATASVFTYRARGPLFCGEEFRIEGTGSTEVDLAAVHPERGTATTATLRLHPRATG